jgi:transcriptional regulator with XRE-family HTH domain
MKSLNLIGRNIGRLRYQRGWTQDMLAAKLQLAGWMISRSKISRIESEQAHVYDFQVFIFSDVFDVEVKHFFLKRLFNPSLTERNKKLRQFHETTHPHKNSQLFAKTGGRVRERRCRHSLPSEPDVRLSPHPAQAATKPRVSGADFTTV